MRLLLARDEEEREEENRIGSQRDLHGIELSVKDQVTNAKQHLVPDVANLVCNAMPPNV
jgi:hypothetical protein